jgi:hypothetical protein
MSYSPTVVKSTQQGTLATSGTSITAVATITAVDTNKTQLTLLGFSTNTATSTYDPSRDLSRITLTNSTTITLTKNSTSGAVTGSYRVVEFY